MNYEIKVTFCFFNSQGSNANQRSIKLKVVQFQNDVELLRLRSLYRDNVEITVNIFCFVSNTLFLKIKIFQNNFFDFILANTYCY